MTSVCVPDVRDVILRLGDREMGWRNLGGFDQV